MRSFVPDPKEQQRLVEAASAAAAVADTLQPGRPSLRQQKVSCVDCGRLYQQQQQQQKRQQQQLLLFLSPCRAEVFLSCYCCWQSSVDIRCLKGPLSFKLAIFYIPKV